MHRTRKIDNATTAILLAAALAAGCGREATSPPAADSLPTGAADDWVCRQAENEQRPALRELLDEWCSYRLARQRHDDLLDGWDLDEAYHQRSHEIHWFYDDQAKGGDGARHPRGEIGGNQGVVLCPPVSPLQFLGPWECWYGCFVDRDCPADQLCRDGTCGVPDLVSRDAAGGSRPPSPRTVPRRPA